MSIPQLYNLPSGFTAGTYEYTIPSYVGNNFRPYIKSAITNQFGIVLDSDDTYTWTELTGWTVEPQTDGTRKLRLYSTPYTDDGRLIWYAPNGPVPAQATLPTLGANISTTTATTLTLTAAPSTPVGETGYLKIDNEYMFYAGVNRSTWVLSNLVRGLFGSTAATHNSAATVNWCIAVDDDRLWTQLEEQSVARLHYLLLHRGTVEDRDNHERIMGWAQDRADKFWRTSGYTGYARTRLKLRGWAI